MSLPQISEKSRTIVAGVHMANENLHNSVAGSQKTTTLVVCIKHNCSRTGTYARNLNQRDIITLQSQYQAHTEHT
jgi:hypothetical protein